MSSGINYLSPLLYPLFPKEIGTLRIEIDCQSIIKRRFRSDATRDTTLTLDLSVYHEGERIEQQIKTVQVKDGRADPQSISLEYAPDELSYLEMTTKTADPVFRDILLGHGYATFSRPGQGVVHILGDLKYSVPQVIKLVEATKTFCVYHGACLSDETAGIGNSFLLSNPYNQPAVAKISADTGRKISRKIPPKCMRIVDLGEILDEGVPGTVMLTGNNRVPTAVLRHPYGEPLQFYSYDHIEPFSGFPSIEKVPFGMFARHKAVNLLKRSKALDF